MATKKVTLKEFKEIIKKIIKEEQELLSVEHRRKINDLKKMGHDHKTAEQLVKDNPDMNAVAIDKKIKDAKLGGGK